MALTEQERNIVRQVKQQGGTREQVIEVLGQHRSRQPKQEFKSLSQEARESLEKTPEEILGVGAFQDETEDKLPKKDKGILQQVGESISKFGEEKKFELKAAEGSETLGSRFKREGQNVLKLGANIGTDILQIGGDTADFIGEVIDEPGEKVESAKVLGRGFLGVIRKAGRFGLELGSGQKLDASKEEKIADAIGRGIKEEAGDKFGTLEKTRNTLTQNPLDTVLFVRGGLKGLKDAGLSKSDQIKIDNLTKEADQAIEQFIKPTKIETKQITKKISPEIQSRLKDGRLKPGDRESIKAVTDANIESTGEKIGAFIEAGKVKGEIDFDGMIDTLVKADSNARVDGNIIPGREAEVKFINSQLDFLGQLEKAYGKNLPAAKQLELRKQYDVVFDKTVTRDKITKFQDELQVDLADILRAELAKNNPDLDKLNKEYTFNIGLQKVLDETLERTTGQDPVGLMNKIGALQQGGAGATVGATVGGVVGGPVGAAVGAIFGGALGLKLTKVLSNPKYRLVDAKKKADLAEAIASGDSTRVEKILDTITIAGGISELSDNE